MQLIYNYETLNTLDQNFWAAFGYNYSDVARDIFYDLNSLFTKEREKQDPALFRKFKIVQAKYGFACLPTLAEDEILDLIKNYLSLAFGINDYDLWAQLKKYLVTIRHEDRDRLKGEIKNILINNTTKITSTNLLIDKKEAIGSASNWVRDYHGQVGTGAVDQLLFEQYFINSPNIKRLLPEEKEKVKTLLKLYEKLKISSKTPQGYEEKVLMKIGGELKVWNEGRLEDLDSAVVNAVKELKAKGFFKEKNETGAKKEPESAPKPPRPKTELEKLKEMAASYAEGSLERMAVEEEIERISHNL